MGETSDQIERHIQETRNDLSDNFNELEAKVRTAVDWRVQFEERPMTMIALAFGGGVLLSALLPSRRSPGRRSSSRAAHSDRPGSDLSFKPRTEYNDTTSQSSETWNALKGALVGVATTKFSGFIEDLLPGFKQEFAKAQTARDNPGQPGWQKSTGAGAD
jgi:hypothetical protein